MRTLVPVLLCLCLAAVAADGAAAPEFGACFYSVLGSDFGRAELSYAEGAGDGDGLYFGRLTVKPSLTWDEVGGLRIVGQISLDDLTAPELDFQLNEATVAVELPAVGELRGGAFWASWGWEGRYLAEKYSICAPGLIKDVHVLGMTLGKSFGGFSYQVLLGLGHWEDPSDDAVTGLSLGYTGEDFSVGLYAAADSKPYDVRQLFFDQYRSRAPGVTNNLIPTAWQDRENRDEVLSTRGDLLQTLSLGLTLDGGAEDDLGYHLTLAYQSYADIDPAAAEGQETGGERITFYPELHFNTFPFEVYAAALIDYWSSNDADGLNLWSPYDSRDPIASTLAYEVYAQAGWWVTENFQAALGGGYLEPSTSGENLSLTSGDESADPSLFVTPRLIWRVEATESGLWTFTLGGEWRQWAPALYDVEGGDPDESREITAWLRLEASI